MNLIMDAILVVLTVCGLDEAGRRWSQAQFGAAVFAKLADLATGIAKQEHPVLACLHLLADRTSLMRYEEAVLFQMEDLDRLAQGSMPPAARIIVEDRACEPSRWRRWSQPWLTALGALLVGGTFMLLAGCGTVATVSKAAVAHSRAAVASYCRIPRVARSVNRAAVALVVAPNRIKVECFGDSLAGSLVGDMAVSYIAPDTQAKLQEATRFAVQAVQSYCRLSPELRATNRELVEQAVQPDQISIECQAQAPDEGRTHAVQN